MSILDNIKIKELSEIDKDALQLYLKIEDYQKGTILENAIRLADMTPDGFKLNYIITHNLTLEEINQLDKQKEVLTSLSKELPTKIIINVYEQKEIPKYSVEV